MHNSSQSSGRILLFNIEDKGANMPRHQHHVNKGVAHLKTTQNFQKTRSIEVDKICQASKTEMAEK